MTTIAYQLYCSRNFPPLDETLAMLSKAGYRSVEGYGGLFDDPDALKKQLNYAGLHMDSAHIGLDVLEGEPDLALNIVKTLDISKVFAPYVQADDRPTDAAGWRAFGQRVADAGKPLRDAGVVFGWHNHDFELEPLASGERPLDLIAEAEGISLELDLGWVARAGEDPAAWIAKYADRIAAVHVKDLAPDGKNADEDGWADVGHGTLDWKAIAKALRAANVTHFVAEHDNPADHARFAQRSLATIETF